MCISDYYMLVACYRMFNVADILGNIIANTNHILTILTLLLVLEKQIKSILQKLYFTEVYGATRCNYCSSKRPIQ